MDFRREQYHTLVERLREPPRTLTFVTGPRQTGKTTLIQQALPDVGMPWHYEPVDKQEPVTRPMLLSTGVEPMRNQRDGEWLTSVWERARAQATSSPDGFILALDEIQKVPNWAEVVKGLWDADRHANLPLRVVLAGSAPLLMQQGLTESLAGRFETIRLDHWAYSEMAQAFDFDLPRYVYFGGYPRAGGPEFRNAEGRWRDYVLDALIPQNIERDILAMQRIDKPALLKQLFELVMEYSGQILAYDKMLGSLRDRGNITTLAHYANLLRRAGLLEGLARYHSTQPNRRASPRKWTTLNMALMTALSDYTYEDAQADRSYWGRLVESAVGAHLCNTAGRDIEVCYWRDSDGVHEVDFVLRGRRRLLAIEVKSSRRRERLAGLEEFAARFKGAQCLLVGADGVPLEEFLSSPATHWLEEETRGVR